VILRPLRPRDKAELELELRKLSVDESCVEIFLDKFDSFLLKITDLKTPAANILKQTALSNGADVAVHRDVITGKVERSDAMFMGTKRQLRRTALAMSGQPFGLAQFDKGVAKLLANLDVPPTALELPSGRLSFENPLLMGVLNVTPDSFSDGGLYLEPDAAKSRIDSMLAEGADIIDVGAESTRPGALPSPASEQLERLVPVFEYLKGKKIPWSLDTTSPEVARAGLAAGASAINDISGGKVPELWSLAEAHKSAYILMHSKGEPRTMQVDPHYDDFSADLFEFFTAKLAEISSKTPGLKSVILDPGIGFGKRVSDNCAALRRLPELKAFGRPLLVGVSRKSFLGKLLGLDVGERLEASLAASVIAFLAGAQILRVHDVKQTRRALDVCSLILKGAGE
jgi:dihydropteroate synthase